MDGQHESTGATPIDGIPVVDPVASDSLVDALKAFTTRLASFGLGEETGRLLREGLEGPSHPAPRVRSRPEP
jgi:hypothetical protein